MRAPTDAIVERGAPATALPVTSPFVLLFMPRQMYGCRKMAGIGMSSILDAYLRNEAAIKRFLKRMVPRAADVDDLAQETFLRAFAADAAEPTRFPKAFLFRIAKNLALNEREKCVNSRTNSLEDLVDPSVLVDGSNASIEEDIELRQRAHLLAQAMATLPPQCSRAFLLRKVYGYSYRSIAERMNISVSTAEKHVASGLVRCSEYLKRQGHDIARLPATKATAGSGPNRRDGSRDE